MTIEKTLAGFIVGLRHVGYVVTDLDAAVSRFHDVYGDDVDVRRMPDQGSAADTLFAFVTIAGTEFELIQPVSACFRELLLAEPSGPAGINHVAWQVRDIDACLVALAERGIRPGHVTPDGIVAFADRRLVYLDPADTGGLLIELIEIDAGC